MWLALLLSPPADTAVLLPVFVLLCLLYTLAAPHFPAERQRAWIISTVASCTMSLAALPFILDYASGGLPALQTRDYLARPVNRFFQAYLAADLLMGGLFYHKQVGLLTGWVHHVAYIAIVEATLRGGWAHIFCFAACMEFPTFLLGLSTLLPRTRSNIAFALSFFATRIALHLTLLYTLALPAGRPGGSITPAFILALAFPMHAMWFWGCLKGFVRRRRIALKEKEHAAVGGKRGHVLAPDIYPDARSLAHHASPSPSTSPSPWSQRWPPRLDRLRRLVAARPRIIKPLRPRAMARRMSETLIGALPSLGWWAS